MRKFPDNPLVSIIVPICGRYEVALENIQELKKLNYPKFEIIVCDDSDKEYHYNTNLLNKIEELADKYFYTATFNAHGEKDYGLARARNTGIIHSHGSILMFCDQRITVADDNVINIFVDKIRQSYPNKVWYFGDKGAQKESFVENFSAVWKRHLVVAGMFNERINKYGGMTREVWARCKIQGFEFEYVPEAHGKSIAKSQNKEKKEKETEEMRNILKKLGY